MHHSGWKILCKTSHWNLNVETTWEQALATSFGGAQKGLFLPKKKKKELILVS